MSHLTAPMPSHSGFHHPQRPFLTDLPRSVHPLTPPDTDYETPSQTFPMQNLTGFEMEPLPGLPAHSQFPSSSVNESPSPFGSLHRKRPSVAYVNSGIREARERVVQRGLKWLVVVLPPVSFTREHGHLGHTLSSGPSRRLSNGIIMPLYPTLNSQLGAIAREFSFPSITGLCVYLHTTYNGIALTPRVSDESWPLLWSHLFDARSPSMPPQQLPIGGQLEFDVDVTRARWYDSWIASSRREYVDVPQSVAPSRPQSLSHWRADSQTSINEPLDDQTDVLSVTQQTTAKAGRNIKKLSLLDRFDAFSVRSGSKLALRDESPPDATAKQSLPSQALSPIVQEDEPATAKKHIDNRVHSWRMSASAAARSPLAATGQTSLDPANMPNTIEDLPTGTESEFELNLDDYTWSVSSVGPPEYDVDIETSFSWDRAPSVHLDRRGEGSVCLTASVCTSFGPDDDYVPFSPSSHLSRLPSPDIAWRMFEDAPPTPTTATSWGAPLSYPPSPAPSSYAPSIDIAARFLSSRPVTPTTATSWGAPLSFPPSPVLFSRPVSPDLGERVADSLPGTPRSRRPFGSYEFVFPYYDAVSNSTWQHVWPYSEGREQPHPSTWHHVWPYVDGQQRENTTLWKHVWPYTDGQQPVDCIKKPLLSAGLVNGEVNSTTSYPVFDIYPAVYPFFDIYPASIAAYKRESDTHCIISSAVYPIFDLYPAVYPSFAIYPSALVIVHPRSKELPTSLSHSYPTVEPYPAVYPYLTVYPALSRNVAISNAVDVSDQGTSLPAARGYPDFDIYPSRHPLNHIHPVAQHEISIYPVQIDVHLQVSYPSFDIYPSVYPYNLDNTYPPLVHREVQFLHTALVPVGVVLQYPVFAIYPAVPAVSVSTTREVALGLASVYPSFDIYPAVYPWNVYELYPTVCSSDEGRSPERNIIIELETNYPVFAIYPAVYPHNMGSIYPGLGLSLSTHSTQSSVGHRFNTAQEPSPKYPIVCPYPPVYPHFSIYPSWTASAEEHSGIQVGLSATVLAVSQYPHLVIYPSVYPYIDLYPGAWISCVQITSIESKRIQKPKYTHGEVRARVFPELNEASRAEAQKVSRKRPRFTHMELRAQVLAQAEASSTSLAPIIKQAAVPEPSRLPVFRPPPLGSLPARSTPVRPLPVHREYRADALQQDRITVPTIVAVEPSPTGSDASTGSPVLFEMVTAPPQSRSRSGTVNSRPSAPSPSSRPVGAHSPSTTQLSSPPEIPPTQRSPNRLSGLPAHPAVRRGMLAAPPRPMSTFGSLPAVPESPSVHIQGGLVSSEGRAMRISSATGRSSQLPSPPEERGWRTPTEPSPGSPLGALGATANLTRSKTMPSRAAPRGPRRSNTFAERMKVFDSPDMILNDDEPLNLSMSTLERFPIPPRPSLPVDTDSTSPSRAVPSRLDRSKYPFK